MGLPVSLSELAPWDAWRYAQCLAASPMLPRGFRGEPASVLWAMEYGRGLGMDVATVMMNIHVIDGRPTQSANFMLAQARTAGHRVRILSERDRCNVSIRRHGDPDDETTIEWTLDDAYTARLLPAEPESHWARYPRAMLRSRAIAEAVRTACPEVLHGVIYTPEECGASVDAEGNPTGRLVTAPPPTRPPTSGAVPPAPPAPKPTTPPEPRPHTAASPQACNNTDASSAAKPAPTAPDEADRIAIALAEMLDAATGMDPHMIARVFRASHGHPIEEATADELRRTRDFLLNGA